MNISHAVHDASIPAAFVSGIVSSWSQDQFHQGMPKEERRCNITEGVGDDHRPDTTKQPYRWPLVSCFLDLHLRATRNPNARHTSHRAPFVCVILLGLLYDGCGIVLVGVALMVILEGRARDL